MNLNQTLIKLLILPILVLGCQKKPVEQSGDSADAISAMSAQLKSVEDEFLPESISNDGSTSPAGFSQKSSNEDICAGVDFVECQPRLIRAYLYYGKVAVGMTQKIVNQVARDLAQAADGSSGTYTDVEKDLSISFVKRSFLDFDLIVLKSNKPVGRVSANPNVYTIQFDVGVLEPENTDSRGGKMEIQVNFTDRKNWHSRLSFTDMACNPLKPEDPQTARIDMTRKGDLWSGQSMFYNGIGGSFVSNKSCSTPASDDTSIVSYTDLVADHSVAKAAIYLFKRNQSDVSQIQNFGINNYCDNYLDRCEALAAILGTTASAVNAHLNQLTNPYCVRRGSKEVTFNSSCEAYSGAVANEPFLSNAHWLSPLDFSQLQIIIPDHL